MTASPVRRTRAVQAGGALVAACAVAVVVVALVAVTTLRASREGRAPEVDTRPVIEFPDTPNAAIGIVDDLERLSSLAILTLAPSGFGGSIVVVPVNVDASNGFGPERTPISRQPFAPGDEAQSAELVSELEPLLTLTIEHAMVLGPDELDDVLAPVAPLDVELPERVVDSDTPGSGFVAAAGPQSLDLGELVAAFTAISGDGTSYSHHDVDVALWTAVAAAGSATSDDIEIPTDDVGRPVPPSSVEDLVARLFAGEVATRDLAITERGAEETENDAGADFVLLDRLDSLLVFTAISPGLVSTPNEALSFRLVVRYSDEQIAQLGDGPDGLAVTKESLIRDFIGELLFSQVNVIAVDLGADAEAVPDTTRLIVREEDFAEALGTLTDDLFPGSDVALADEVIDGVDVDVVLGLDFLEARERLIEDQRTATDGEGDDADEEPPVFVTPTDSDVTDAPGSSNTEPSVGTAGSVDDSDTVADDGAG